MPKAVWFLFGMATVIVVAAISGGTWLTSVGGFSTRQPPTALERWIARRARSLAVPPSAKTQTNQTPDSPETLVEARAHWADHCASCHANNGSGDTELGKHLFPPAPDMRSVDTQNLSDGELFYIIQNGVRLTGMPGWGSGSSHDAQDSWKLVRFIRHLPQMTPKEETEMRQLNPKTPDDLKEEQDEEEFLNGGQSHEHTHEHH
jgi:mono/diheme cytochrome c family protein